MSCFGRRPNKKKFKKLCRDPPFDRHSVEHNQTNHAENFRCSVTHVSLQRVLVINEHNVNTANSNRRTETTHNYRRSNDKHLCNLNNINRVGSQTGVGLQREVVMCYTTNPNISYIIEPNHRRGHVTDEPTRYTYMGDARRNGTDDENRRRRMADYQQQIDLTNTVQQGITLPNMVPKRAVPLSRAPHGMTFSNGVRKELSIQNAVKQEMKVPKDATRQGTILPNHIQQKGILRNHVPRRIVLPKSITQGNILPSNVPQGIALPQMTHTWHSVIQTKEKVNLEQVLDDLNDTLDSYCVELDVNHSNNLTEADSGVDSANESFDGSIPPHIETNHETKPGRKRLSVSFQLPADHVDKPYSPIQFSKSKSRRRYHTNESQGKDF